METSNQHNTADCFVFARRFASQRRRGWAIYPAAFGVMSLVFIVLGNLIMSMVGLLIVIGAAVAFGWMSAIAGRLRAEITEA
jgi:drug/metabolite transporter (DMT)-like permease